MRKYFKLNKYKKAIILISIVIFSLNSINIENPKALSPLFFFSLEARCLNYHQLEYLNLMKQQLARIGVNLIVEYFNFSEVSFLGTLLAFRDFDLQLIQLPCNYYENPYHTSLYVENGSENFAGYHTSMDWDNEINSGRNEWYIQNGLQMISNDSQEQLTHCWEWQHYMMDDILPILPLFTQKNNRSSFELLFFNMREVRPVIGSRSPAPLVTSKSIGLLIRKAISYAINREEIRRVVLGDEYEIIHHPIDPILDEWLNPNSIRYCYNLEVAQELMYIAGYQVGWWDVTYPNWEDVCNGNITASAGGFILGVTCLSLITIAFSVYYKRRRRSKNKEKLICNEV